MLSQMGCAVLIRVAQLFRRTFFKLCPDVTQAVLNWCQALGWKSPLWRKRIQSSVNFLKILVEVEQAFSFLVEMVRVCLSKLT